MTAALDHVHPPYLPPHLAIEVAQDTPLSEPELFYLAFQRDRGRLGQEPVAHTIPVAEITTVSFGIPGLGPLSLAAQAAEAAGLVSFHPGERYVMGLTFDRAIRGHAADLRPDLPVVLRW